MGNHKLLDFLLKQIKCKRFNQNNLLSTHPFIDNLSVNTLRSNENSNKMYLVTAPSDIYACHFILQWTHFPPPQEEGGTRLRIIQLNLFIRQLGKCLIQRKKIFLVLKPYFVPVSTEAPQNRLKNLSQIYHLYHKC